MNASVNRKDARYPALLHGHNLRFPQTLAEGPGSIVVCPSAAELARALQVAIHEGLRPTVRSGGHCYEDFAANNPGGVLLDVSLMNRVSTDNSGTGYRVEPGALLGDMYGVLYKLGGVTLPGGSCYTVGAGGHIPGGGYGLLSRLHGLTSDWLTGVDLLTVDAGGTVRPQRVEAKSEPELMRALRGAGTAGLGAITAFYFETLPKAPRETVQFVMHFPWENMSEEDFIGLVTTYGDYWATRGRDAETWGLFTILTVGARKQPHPRLGMGVYFVQPEGGVEDTSVLREFVDRFRKWKPTYSTRTKADDDLPGVMERGRMAWLTATVGDRSGGFGSRAKYKSAYMKRTFTPAEAATIYRFYTGDSPTAAISVVSMDSYGGAINRAGMLERGSICQRSSVMKLQWQCYWQSEDEDRQHLEELDQFYTAIYTGDHVDAQHQGTPWGEGYEGCYMNYPDADMLRYSYWPQLYYGTGDLYPTLQRVKRRCDPHNIFHHAMSVRPGEEG